MRRIASLMLCGFALTAGAAEVWRWKDANGVTQISDRPVPGAERVTVSPPRPGAPPAPVATPSSEGRTEPNTQFVSYRRCAMEQPTADAVYQAADPVLASLSLEPSLQDGHRVQAFLNGAQVAEWPADATSHTFADLYRGSYTLGLRVIDAAGHPVCLAASITFHVRQPSVLSPLRRPQPRR